MHHYSQRFCQVQGAVQRTVESRRVENRLCLQGPRWSAKELTRMGTYKHCVLRWKQEMGWDSQGRLHAGGMLVYTFDVELGVWYKIDRIVC